MLNKIKLVCVEVTPMEGYAVIQFQASSNDEAIYIAGNIGIQIADATGFELGKSYGLHLKETIE